MGNVLSDDKKQQVLALGRLGWSLRRIEAATDVRRETASGYLRAAGGGSVGGAGQSPASAARSLGPGGEPTLEDAQTTPRGSSSTVLSVAHSLTTRYADHVGLYSPPELLPW